MALDPKQQEQLLAVMSERFSENKHRHKGIKWTDVASRLLSRPESLLSIASMESTGGEPDVIGRDKKTGEILVVDCSAESPAGRRSLCYDDDALDSRKEHRPAGSAMSMAASMGVTLLREDEYRLLQSLGEFDLKTSSWLLTPAPIRELGGAIFGDRRYDTVFVYHNGAQSYYAVRGFRGILRI